MPHADNNKVQGVVLLTEGARQYLNPREELAYQEHRRELADWLLNLGKNPNKADGYSHSTAKNTMNRLDLFYRWVWQAEHRYVQDMTPAHADAWMRHLAKQELKESTKCHYQKSVKTLFKWQRDARNRDVEWEPVIEYSDPSTAYQPRDYLTAEDRRKMCEAAMSYGSIPHYNSLTPAERDRWKKYLAQRLQKPEREVTKRDFLQANSFKYTSMIYVALDAGFRPIEVERAYIQWLDLDNGVLRIPEDESSKSRENWIVALKPETVSILKKWTQERAAKAKYDGRDVLWLTQKGNRYNRNSFRRSVFQTIAREAGLDLETVTSHPTAFATRQPPT